MQFQSTRRTRCVCAQCGAEFLLFASQIARGGGVFCSFACRAAHQIATPDYFWSFVRRDGLDACWEWTGRLDARGYGKIKMSRRNLRAHRVAWELVAGPIPAGLSVCHVCDNPPCVRNDDVGTYEVNGVLHPRRGHLWLGTTADNAADMAMKGRSVNGSRSHPELMARGEHNGFAKLTEGAVREIRDAVATGRMTRGQAAATFDVTPENVALIISGRTWRHVKSHPE